MAGSPEAPHSSAVDADVYGLAIVYRMGVPDLGSRWLNFFTWRNGHQLHDLCFGFCGNLHGYLTGVGEAGIWTHSTCKEGGCSVMIENMSWDTMVGLRCLTAIDSE